MLLGTHPIPARSPAEREGQNGKEMMRKGDRGREEEEDEEGRGVCGWTMGFSRWNDWGEETEKSRDFGRRGVEDDGYSRGGEKRENGGITCYVNERRRLFRARENHQQLKMTTSGHINIRLQQLKACPHDSGGRREHRDGVKQQQRHFQ